MHTYIQSARDAETIDSGMNMAYDLEQMSFWFSATDAPSVQSRGGSNWPSKATLALLTPLQSDQLQTSANHIIDSLPQTQSLPWLLLPPSGL